MSRLSHKTRSSALRSKAESEPPALKEVLDHYDAFVRRVARLNPPPNLPPFLSSNGLVVDRGFLTADERLLKRFRLKSVWRWLRLNRAVVTKCS